MTKPTASFEPEHQVRKRACPQRLPITDHQKTAAYLGIGRVLPFLHAVNDVLTARGRLSPQPERPAVRLRSGKQITRGNTGLEA